MAKLHSVPPRYTQQTTTAFVSPAPKENIQRLRGSLPVEICRETYSAQRTIRKPNQMNEVRPGTQEGVGGWFTGNGPSGYKELDILVYTHAVYVEQCHHRARVVMGGLGGRLPRTL